MVRSVLAIAVGYLIFGISSLLLFRLSGQDPTVLPTPEFLVFSIVFGLVFAFASGYLAGLIAGVKPRLHAGIVAIFIGGVALFSLLMDFGETSPWSQLAGLVIMAPSALLGGWVRGYQTRPPLEL